jgi:hypothetical protein
MPAVITFHFKHNTHLICAQGQELVDEQAGDPGGGGSKGSQWGEQGHHTQQAPCIRATIQLGMLVIQHGRTLHRLMVSNRCCKSDTATMIGKTGFE